jgi:hypothetical protein
MHIFFQHKKVWNNFPNADPYIENQLFNELREWLVFCKFVYNYFSCWIE